MLKAAWLEAAARVWASAATSIRWVCRAGDSETMVPTANTAGKIVHTECAASGNTSSTKALHSRSQATAWKRRRSNSQPPNTLPTMPPRPKAARAKGVQPAVARRVGVERQEQRPQQQRQQGEGTDKGERVAPAQPLPEPGGQRVAD